MREFKNEPYAPSYEMSEPAAKGQLGEVGGVFPGGGRLSLRWGRWLVAVVILVLAGSIAYYRTINAQTSVQYITAPVKRGNVSVALTATGTVNPVTVVEVGTFVSGPIVHWYCDFNARVAVGQLCAQIDPRQFQVAADQAAANLLVAKAQLAKDQANLAYAKTTYERDVGLLKPGIVSQTTVDSDKSTYDQAVAQVSFDESSIQERQAEVHAAQVNLGFTRIISPVNGIVVSRNIEIGQTVAASFQTPILFLIATDLTKMQVDTSVSESDIGGVKEGDRATFSVLPFPTRQFEGAVRQVRQAPSTVQNVVTYDVVVAVDNRDGLLKPGMTATTRIIKAEHDSVLMLPDQALRFLPEGARTRRLGAPAKDTRGSVSADGSRQARAWALRGGKPTAVPVTVGIEDGTSAEIIKADLSEGDQVIVAEARAGARSTGTAGQPPRFFQAGGR
jgi:HlyD family secretion protein